MNDNKSLYRILVLISLLGKESGYTARQLAAKFDISDKTIYRYFNLLKDAGFSLLSDKNKRYYIKKYNATAFSEKLLSFSVEEAAMIKDALMAVNPDNPLKNQALHKPFAFSELDDITEIIYDQHVGQVIGNIRKAIKNKKQIVLCDYHSSNSKTIKNRLVEPISFHPNMKYFYAYEPKSKQVKQFKPERVGKVEISPTAFRFRDRHVIPEPDIFGMNAEPIFTVDLRLSLRGRNLLLEEHPLSRYYLDEGRQENTYLFSDKCKGYEGVGRFVLGLPGEVEVLGDDGFKNFLSHKVKNFKKTFGVTEGEKTMKYF